MDGSPLVRNTAALHFKAMNFSKEADTTLLMWMPCSKVDGRQPLNNQTGPPQQGLVCQTQIYPSRYTDFCSETDTPLIDFRPDIPIREDEDLISLEVSEVLNSPWSVSASEVLSNTQRYSRAKVFPALGGNAVHQGSGQSVRPMVGQNSRGVVQGLPQGVPQTPVNQGLPHSWNNGGNVAGNIAGNTTADARAVGQISAHRGPPHTWGKAITSATNSTAQGHVNPNGQATGQAHGQKVVSGGSGQFNNNHGRPHTWGKTNTPAAPTTEANVNFSSRDPRSNPSTRQAPSHSNNSTSGWDNSETTSTQIKPSSVASSHGGPVQNPWGKKNLFPNALPAVTPPVDLLSSLNINTAQPPTKLYRMFDPADPAFRASKFYVEIIGRWKCPHPGCK